MKIDFHTHSTSSDGIFKAEDLLLIANQHGISHLALTDHDSMDGFKNAKKIAEKLNLRFFNGIEFTAHITEDKYEHILGYGIREYELVETYLKKLREERIFLVKQYVNILQSVGYKVTFEDICSITPGEYITIGHIAKWLNKNDPKCNLHNAYSMFIGTKGKYHIPEKCHYYDEILKLIQDSGGFSVLAHPFRYNPIFRNNYRALEKYILFLKTYGLNGIEAFYGTHSNQEIEACVSIAKKHNLIITGGSDFHGWEDKVPIGISLPEEYLKIFISKNI